MIKFIILELWLYFEYKYMIKYILNEKYSIRCSYVSQTTMIKFVKIVERSKHLPTIIAISKNNIIAKFYFTIKKVKNPIYIKFFYKLWKYNITLKTNWIILTFYINYKSIIIIIYIYIYIYIYILLIYLWYKLKQYNINLKNFLLF